MWWPSLLPSALARELVSCRQVGWHWGLASEMMNKTWVSTNHFSGWWFGLKHVLFSPLPGKMIQFNYYFSNGLKPPTSFVCFFPWSFKGTKPSNQDALSTETGPAHQLRGVFQPTNPILESHRLVKLRRNWLDKKMIKFREWYIIWGVSAIVGDILVDRSCH